MAHSTRDSSSISRRDRTKCSPERNPTNGTISLRPYSTSGLKMGRNAGTGPLKNGPEKRPFNKAVSSGLFFVPIINSSVSGCFVASAPEFTLFLPCADKNPTRPPLSFDRPPRLTLTPRRVSIFQRSQEVLPWLTVPTASKTVVASPAAILDGAIGVGADGVETSRSAATCPAGKSTASTVSSPISKRRSALERSLRRNTITGYSRSTFAREKNSRGNRRSSSSRRSSAFAGRSYYKSTRSTAGLGSTAAQPRMESYRKPLRSRLVASRRGALWLGGAPRPFFEGSE